MFLPYVCFFWLLQVSVFLSVGGVVTFFFCTCVYLFGVVILHTCIRLFDIIILCTGVCLCDTILCVLEGASTDSRADGCGCSVMPVCHPHNLSPVCHEEVSPKDENYFQALAFASPSALNAFLPSPFSSLVYCLLIL